MSDGAATAGTVSSSSMALPRLPLKIRLNGEAGEVYAIDSVKVSPFENGFSRGDTNGDGSVDISDGIATLQYLFLGGAADCEDAADANDDGVVDVSDGIFILDFLFKGGRAPPPPYPAPGLDPSEDGLLCGRLSAPGRACRSSVLE